MILSIFSCAYWPFVQLLWRNVYLNPLPIQKNWVVCNFVVEFFLFDPHHKYDSKYSLHSLGGL